MACIRSERKAIDRQYPAEMPTGYEVYDERYADTPSGKVDTTSGEIVGEDGVVEGEFTETTTSDANVSTGVGEEEPELWPDDTPPPAGPAPEPQVAQGARWLS